jgi:hypothetical protein
LPEDPYDQETLYRLWLRAGRNAAAVEREVYKYDGGVAHWYAVYGINAALKRRGRPAVYKEKDA